MVAIKGQKRKAVIVGVKQKQKALIPKFDSNNIVLIEDNGNCNIVKSGMHKI